MKKNSSILVVRKEPIRPTPLDLSISRITFQIMQHPVKLYFISKILSTASVMLTDSLSSV